MTIDNLAEDAASLTKEAIGVKRVLNTFRQAAESGKYTPERLVAVGERVLGEDPP